MHLLAVRGFHIHVEPAFDHAAAAAAAVVVADDDDVGVTL